MLEGERDIAESKEELNKPQSKQFMLSQLAFYSLNIILVEIICKQRLHDESFVMSWRKEIRMEGKKGGKKDTATLLLPKYSFLPSFLTLACSSQSKL